MWKEDTSPINPNYSSFSTKWKKRATLKMAVPVHAGTPRIVPREDPVATKATKVCLHKIFVYQIHIVIYVSRISSKLTICPK